mgnify:CR=1 FL=1
MGVESDQEILQLVGTETAIENGLAASLQECCQLRINSCYQALDYIGSRVVASKRQFSTSEVLKYAPRFSHASTRMNVLYSPSM